MQDEEYPAVFEYAAESVTGDFANNFARRLRYSPVETDYPHSNSKKINEAKKPYPGIFG